MSDGNRPGHYRNASARQCPRCQASPGQPCTYTDDAGTHRAFADGRWQQVPNVPGEPMLRMHRQRARVPCCTGCGCDLTEPHCTGILSPAGVRDLRPPRGERFAWCGDCTAAAFAGIPAPPNPGGETP